MGGTVYAWLFFAHTVFLTRNGRYNVATAPIVTDSVQRFVWDSVGFHFFLFLTAVSPNTLFILKIHSLQRNHSCVQKLVQELHQPLQKKIYFTHIYVSSNCEHLWLRGKQCGLLLNKTSTEGKKNNACNSTVVIYIFYYLIFCVSDGWFQEPKIGSWTFGCCRRMPTRYSTRQTNTGS